MAYTFATLLAAFGITYCYAMWLQRPCHKGSFDLETDKPLAGPPRRPLARIKLEIVNEAIHATGVEVSTV